MKLLGYVGLISLIFPLISIMKLPQTYEKYCKEEWDNWINPEIASASTCILALFIEILYIVYVACTLKYVI